MENTIAVNARFLTQSITGVQRFAIELSRRLKGIYGSEIQFFAPKNIVNAELADELNIIIIGHNTGHIWEQMDLPNFLKSKGNPLLLNLANTAPLFYKNKIVTIHDVAFLAYPETYSKKFLFFYKFLIPKVIYSSKHVLTVSDFSKSEIVKFYKISQDKITVIYNAVANQFSIGSSSLEQAKVPYLVAVSSLNYRKNLHSVLAAFQRISNEYNNNLQLIVIGDIKSKIFKSIDIQEYSSNTAFQFVGRVSDEELIKFYTNALGFIYPSYYEGFGIPPLEAQACGCPVIVSNVSSLPEVFKDSALYCNPNSIDEISNAMITLVKDKALREQLVEKGRQNLLRFSWDQSALKLSNIINNNIK
ncbi:glycosyltransferase family 4 protein [Flavobacterium sp. HJJ]|uniref:glycosyltransferase family 4 protein n=1 Tax=Flavobacterium sp. HJJ TaxID=2783792 RepID=UPI00188B4B93|nr:glycosyltransferase family 1 protein [Flavobacterium sp. HJJ]MBF4470432.1 glycosyltransferase family 4 protein [Flavobacterium sp. HJJ]